MTIAHEHASRRADWGAVLFALVYPTLLTVVYFILLAGSSTALQQGTYAIGKFIQFAFPALWIVGIQRTRVGWSRPRHRELVWGSVLGLGLLAAALAMYHFAVKPAGLFAGAAGASIRQKIEGFGVGSLSRYVVLAAFYSLVHSLLEEYYWRWFVFGRLRHLTSLPAAIGISSLGFMAHHVCIVSTFFGWLSPMSIVLSLAVAAGGAIWAAIYHRTNSLFAPWLSHALVDAAIFLIGYDLVM
ncbi:MAG: CPBP family intramembrane glutamic endopeptidase [Deltaproteobacteria bacterium]